MLLPIFLLDDPSQETTVVEGGVRAMAAVQMAINKINDKHDGVLDKLLPETKVRHK